MTRSTKQADVIPVYKEWAKKLKVTKQFTRPPKTWEPYTALEIDTGIPAKFIFALHMMECDGDFTKHLANGDPINKRTVNEPTGIPGGTFHSTAVSALWLKDWVNNPELDWKDPYKLLWRAELYNGWGYWEYRPEVPTPYLWSGTNLYSTGKYESDGKFNPNLVSQQIGVVPILMSLGINFK